MSIKVYPHYSGRQFERYQAQFMGMMAGFQIQDGVDRDNDGKKDLHRVSVRSGSAERAVIAISKRDGSFNSGSRTLPVITVDIERFSLDPQRNRNPRVQQYLATGDGYGTTTRVTAIPMIITFRVSLLASSRSELFELFEQIITKFTPGLSVPLYTDISKTQNHSIATVVSIDPETSIDLGSNSQINQLSMSIDLPVHIEHPQSSINATIKSIEANVKHMITDESLGVINVDETTVLGE